MNLPGFVDLEKLVIGSTLLNQDHLDSIRGSLTIEDFTVESHRRIWKVACELYDGGTPVDRITVFQALSERGYGSINLTYLAGLDDGLPQLPNVSAYVDRLREATIRRRIILSAQHLAIRAADESEPVDAVLAEMGNMLVDITQATNGAGGPISTHEMIEREGIQNLLAARQQGGIRIPLANLDRALGGLSGGQMIVVMAATSRGKTSLALQLAMAASLHGFPPVIWTLEMSKRAMFQKLSTQLSGVYSGKQRLTYEEREALRMASVTLDENRIYLDSDARNVGSFVAGLRRVKAQGRLGMAVVDHLQLIRSTSSRNRAQEVSENSRSLKLAAMDLDIPFLVLSQVDRSSVKGDGVIGLHSAKESGDIENDADVVMWVQSGAEFSRDQDTLVSLHVGKQREGAAGFSIPMVFRPQSQTFMEVENESK